jgi:hypothetical protein
VLAPETPLTPQQWQVLLSIWSAVHGFAHLALAGQFDAIAPSGGRATVLRELVSPMLERQLVGLRMTAQAAELAQRPSATRRRRTRRV